METRDFGWALKMLKAGEKLFRYGWNGKGQYIALQIPDSGSMNTLPYLYIITVDGKRVPWLASQTDMLAEDWEIYGAGQVGAADNCAGSSTAGN